MRIVMMGTGGFAVPTFAALLDSPHQIPALITRPTPAGRGRRKTPANPMRDLANARDLQVIEPALINDSDARHQLAQLDPELLIVCDYGQILSAETLSIAALGGINLHGSLLPQYRGAAPVNWALYDGQPTTGVTVIHMTPRLDAGPALVQRSLTIAPTDDAVSLEGRLAELGVAAVLEAVEMLTAWDRTSPLGQVQDNRAATRAPRLRKEDGQLDWQRSATQLANQIRAFKPWPGSYTHLEKDSQPMRLIVDEAQGLEPTSETRLESESMEPGQIVRADGDQLWVATGQGVLAILALQPAGRRVMQTAEFLRGHSLAKGTRLGQ